MRSAGDILRQTVAFALATGHLLFPLALAGVVPVILLEHLIGYNTGMALIVAFAGAQFITGALTVTAWGLMRGDVFDPAQDLTHAILRSVPLTALGFIVGGIVAGGLALLIVPGLYMMAALALTVPILMLEGGGLRAMMQSWDRTDGVRWTLVSALVVGLGMLMLGIMLIDNVVATLGLRSSIGVVVDGLFSALSITATTAFTVQVYAALGGQRAAA
jgi:hypothetical protein